MRSAISGWLLWAVALPAQVTHVDVVVRDGHSRIVRDLETVDFAVRENGGDASIRSVEAADPKQRHLVSLLFDDLRGEPARLAREAAFELLNAAAKANICFGVFKVDRNIRVEQAFTGDVKSVRKAVELTTGKKVPAYIENPSLEAENELQAVTRNIVKASAALARETRTPPAVVALLALMRGEGAQPGRKTIVYFSQGLPVDPNQEGFRVLVSTGNRAGVAVYTVDAAGLAVSRDEEVRRAAALQTVARVSGDQVAGREGPGGGPPATVYEQTALAANGERGSRGSAANSALSALARQTGGFIVENSASFRMPMRRIGEELTAYYDIAYVPPTKEPDGSFRNTRVEVKRGKFTVQGREGYFATPDLSGRPALPYELTLLNALQRNPNAREFAHQAAVLRFRSEDGKQPAVTVAVEVPVNELEFQEDAAAGVFRARVSVLALVRGEDGTVVERVGGDTPIVCPAGMLGEMRRRFVSIQKQVDLPAGKYVLETAVEDRAGGRFSTSRAEFAVEPVNPGLGLSSVTVARAVLAASNEQNDGGLQLDGKNVQPALNGVASGAANGAATLFFRVYRGDGETEPIELALEAWQGEKRVLHSAMRAKDQGGRSWAEILSLDVSKAPPGSYELRVIATQGQKRAEERTRLVIDGGGKVKDPVSGEDAEIQVAPAAEPSSPPTAEQKKLWETARANALKYSERLPNFICTQVTRRMLDAGGKGDWRTLEESTDLLTFYDGKEHYSPLASRARASDGGSASVNSAGEFGSILKEIFEPSSAARFSWLREEQIRGRPVQVFSYSVDAARSQYRVTYRGAQQKPPVFSAFHGLVAVEPETATVLKLTLETGPLPADIPVRQITLAMDYDEVGVADQVYLLPLAVTLDVRLHKKTVARNEVSFRSYQRFGADSRVTFQTN